MRPTLLKPGMKVVVKDCFEDREMTFLRRERQPCRAAVNYFQCDAYRSLYGVADQGICTITDYRISRFVFPKEAGR